MGENTVRPDQKAAGRMFFRRTSHCWACGTDLDNATHDECAFCGWIMCPQCGACNPNCTLSHKTGRDAELRRIVRDYLLKNPDVDGTSLDRYINEQKAFLKVKRERAKQEEQKRERQRYAELVKELVEKMKYNRNVIHRLYGRGEIIKLFSDKGKQKILVRFGKEEKRFNFPETFLNGGMELSNNSGSDGIQ